jgi:hypothetical protein
VLVAQTIIKYIKKVWESLKIRPASSEYLLICFKFLKAAVVKLDAWGNCSQTT